MPLAPPQISSSLQSHASPPGTTVGAATTGVDPIGVVITPENQPSTLAAVIAGGFSMLTFAWGWNKSAGNLARVKMSSASPADKKALRQSRWNGATAGALLGGALWLTPNDYKRWALVAGLPLTSYFLPGLLRGGLLGFWPPTKKRVRRQDPGVARSREWTDRLRDAGRAALRHGDRRLLHAGHGRSAAAPLDPQTRDTR